MLTGGGSDWGDLACNWPGVTGSLRPTARAWLAGDAHAGTITHNGVTAAFA
jgi:hypothetical protein